MSMQPWWGHLSGVIILLMMAVFIGIWIWAWRPRHQASFGRLARLPLDDLASGVGAVDMDADKDTDTRPSDAAGQAKGARHE
ncbi:protein of unknown function [Sterolibacterium denitrificans]|uniref:Uncharacterized protein n=1 Tax=Sterolibacterium denitrificans TaxID=157592 RepID=A0A7Z7HPZ9_9PROT|nr:cbb3-type cytochrome c oxidase subunit 3 [Sterolibacterium denitrificans]SMB22218.1 protein of unknown function [Sterolibacterium denitrificans]